MNPIGLVRMHGTIFRFLIVPFVERIEYFENPVKVNMSTVFV